MFLVFLLILELTSFLVINDNDLLRSLLIFWSDSVLFVHEFVNYDKPGILINHSHKAKNTHIHKLLESVFFSPGYFKKLALRR